MSIAQRRFANELFHNNSEEDMILLKHVASTVKKYRDSLKIDIAVFSTITGISYENIVEFEAGLRDIDLKNLVSIANALNVSTADLVDMSQT